MGDQRAVDMSRVANRCRVFGSARAWLQRANSLLARIVPTRARYAFVPNEAGVLQLTVTRRRLDDA
jgi:hypothetical protein